ncbi:hypothetical protein CN221_36035 [Sinorhizobium meliloti]|uniref:hypothetical protein n=1 Tax=Rhizobium meliloti TaxID=382 RepID=UPI000421FB5B|nr:hypothetical protein [Sinorhizobium meliloti]ARS65926.1 hypothetical protein SMRU11_00220 [Sinorhizobium meliloti RU11/001]RVG82557.1 hypothetical protein CN221_36035 [Sinorhizobium meliloti]RVH54424.1 hypothetical protein CN209_35705 [Sinorhizobium meliloti]
MQEIRQVAAAIDLRVRQLEAQGIKGPAIADHMFGCMAGLQRIYDTASDETLIDLSRRYPGFHHYASLMEALSEKNQAMMEAGTHPHGDLPVLPEPIKLSLEKLLASAAELERGYQSAVDSGRFADHINELTGLKHRWADDLQSVVRLFQSSDVPLRSQALVQQVLKTMAERINRLGQG